MNLFGDILYRYCQLYGTDPEVIIQAPGRVNLIGEHTDYNDGYVLPVAIDKYIVVAAGKRKDMQFHLHTVDFQKTIEVPISCPEYDEDALWSNYPKGVASILLSEGFTVGGANFCFRGNVPIAAGLSSSAAIEVATVLAFARLNRLDLSLREVVRIARKAETDFVGVQCGIMDQFVSVFGKKNMALFLDCKTLDYKYVHIPEQVALVVFDTGVRRELPHSAYNRREAECEDALRQISKLFKPLRSLREISLHDFESVERALTPTARKRARHVISENERVLQGVNLLEKNDVQGFGKLMFESHWSLQHEYEVSCHELDTFVDIAKESEGVLGARMTGAGFGGSAIALVENDALDDFVKRVRKEYPKRASHSLTIYLPLIANGAAIATAQTRWQPTLVFPS